MRIASLALAVALAACGGKSNPEPTPTDNTTTDVPNDTPADPTGEPAAVTPEECEASGGQVAWDIGDGSVQCPAGTYETSKVSGGVEAGLCCAPTPANAE